MCAPFLDGLTSDIDFAVVAQSRHSERLANGPADLCSERSPLGVARAACFERLAGVFAKRDVRAT